MWSERESNPYVVESAIINYPTCNPATPFYKSGCVIEIHPLTAFYMFELRKFFGLHSNCAY